MAQMRFFQSIAFFCCALRAHALDNGLGRTPQMGYNSWYDVGMGPTEALVRDTIDAMVSGGFVAAGYTYLNLDDGIVEKERDANGDLVPDKKGFPNGFKVCPLACRLVPFKT